MPSVTNTHPVPTPLSPAPPTRSFVASPSGHGAAPERAAYNIDDLVSRVLHSAPDAAAFVALRRYVRGEGLRDVDWLGRSEGLVKIIQGLATQPAAVYGAATPTVLAEARLRLMVSALKAYGAACGGYLDKELASVLYTALDKLVHVAGGQFGRDAGLLFKAYEARALVSGLASTQTRSERLLRKAKDVGVLAAGLASTLIPVLAPTPPRLLPTGLKTAQGSKVLGVALVQDLVTPRPRPEAWYKEYRRWEGRVEAVEVGAVSGERVRRVIEKVTREARLAVHMATPGTKLPRHRRLYLIGMVELCQRLLAACPDGAALADVAAVLAHYASFAERKGHRLLTQKVATLWLACDVVRCRLRGGAALSTVSAQLDAAAELLRRDEAAWRGARALRHAWCMLYEVGVPQDLDSVPEAHPPRLDHRLPR
jgi:hypothetical protein